MVVIGLGPVGLLTVQVARRCGAGRIFGIDIDPTPLKTAEQLGCDVVINSREQDPVKGIKEVTKGKGVDLVLSSVDNPQDIGKALSMVKRGGTLVLQYGPHGDLVLPFTDLCGERKILTVVGYTEAEQAFAIKLVTDRHINHKALITHRFSLEEVEEAFEVATHKEKYKTITVMMIP